MNYQEVCFIKKYLISIKTNTHKTAKIQNPNFRQGNGKKEKKKV